MTDPDRRHTPEDERSDIEQAVDARSDAVANGEGGGGRDPSPDAEAGEGGADGVVKNQGDAGQ